MNTRHHPNRLTGHHQLVRTAILGAEPSHLVGDEDVSLEILGFRVLLGGTCRHERYSQHYPGTRHDFQEAGPRSSCC